MRITRVILAVAVLAGASACSDNSNPSSPSDSTSTTPATLTKPTPDSPADGAQTDTKRPTLTVNNGTSNQSSTPKTYEFQISDNVDVFTASALVQRLLRDDGEREGGCGGHRRQDELHAGRRTSQPTTRFYWRARMSRARRVRTGPTTARFKTKLVGLHPPGRALRPADPRRDRGERVGQTTFIPGKGIRLDNGQSYVPLSAAADRSRTVSSRWTWKASRRTRPATRRRSSGCRKGQDDFITNRYRVDIQYRGTTRRAAQRDSVARALRVGDRSRA